MSAPPVVQLLLITLTEVVDLFAVGILKQGIPPPSKRFKPVTMQTGVLEKAVVKFTSTFPAEFQVTDATLLEFETVHGFELHALFVPLFVTEAFVTDPGVTVVHAGTPPVTFKYCPDVPIASFDKVFEAEA